MTQENQNTQSKPAAQALTRPSGFTLGDQLPAEIKRNRKLLEEYKKLGAVGGFGAAMIEEDIDRAVNALASGDVTKMLKAYHAMVSNQ